MSVLRILPAAALVAAGSTLSACVTTPDVPEQYQALCSSLGAPPGSPDYGECIGLIYEAIEEYRSELEADYANLPFDVDWDCEAERQGETIWILCEPILY